MARPKKVAGEKGEGSQLCFRHPTKPARRKCYHCGRHICPQCQIKAEKHIFCSKACTGKHRRRAFWDRLAKWNRSALAGTWFRTLFFSCLALVAGMLVFLSLNTQWFVPYPAAQREIAKPKKEKIHKLRNETPDWNSMGPIEITRPKSGETSRASSIAVLGTAPPEAMVGLYVNEEQVAVQMATDGNWKFEGVPLTSPTNVIQARYFDNLGDSSFSKALTVKLEGLPARLPQRVPAILEPPAPPALSMSRAPRGKQEVLLTFDGGSNAGSTPAVLQALKQRGIKVTIFLTGEYIRKFPEFVREMVSDGHVIGNHLNSHPHLTTFSFNGRSATLSGVTKGFLLDQLSKTDEAFKAITGRSMDPYWRAPFGEFNRDILAWGASAGYRHLAWTPRLDTLDWVADRQSPLYRGPEQILSKILKVADSEQGGLDGGIILMHLGTEREGEQSAHTILPPLLTQISSRGYSFVDIRDVWPATAEAATPPNR